MPPARAKDKGGREIFVPKEPFTAQVDGTDMAFTPQTLVREGHPILEKYPHLFEPVRVHYDVEQATSSPGEKRGG